jgi:hypothetical protein
VGGEYCDSARGVDKSSVWLYDCTDSMEGGLLVFDASVNTVSDQFESQRLERSQTGRPSRHSEIGAAVEGSKNGNDA